MVEPNKFICLPMSPFNTKTNNKNIMRDKVSSKIKVLIILMNNKSVKLRKKS